MAAKGQFQHAIAYVSMPETALPSHLLRVTHQYDGMAEDACSVGGPVTRSPALGAEEAFRGLLSLLAKSCGQRVRL